MYNPVGLPNYDDNNISSIKESFSNTGSYQTKENPANDLKLGYELGGNNIEPNYDNFVSSANSNGEDLLSGGKPETVELSANKFTQNPHDQYEHPWLYAKWEMTHDSNGQKNFIGKMID